MRLSKHLGRTFRQPPADAQTASHALLVRAGFVRGGEGGLFAWLPLGCRTLERLRSEMWHALSPLAAQEVALPQAAAGPSEAAGALVRLAGHEIDSYRQLPVWVVQAADQGAPYLGARPGLFGAAERPMVLLHGLGDAQVAQAGSQVEEALDRLFAACEVPAFWAEAGPGLRRACFLHPTGDEPVARCGSCGHAAALPRATTAWPAPPGEPELPTEEVHTPGCDTIAALAAFLGIPASRTLKMVFYSVEGRVTCIVIRGDRKVDEAKLARVLGTSWYYTSLEDELEAIGAVGGYASPIGLDPQRVRVVADPSVRAGANYVGGANRPDYHIRNVNVPRDFSPGEWADLALIEAGDPCPRCGSTLEVVSAFTLAHNRAPVALEATYRDEAGQARPLWLAEWQVDLGRLLAAAVEAHHDDYGIRWPIACAPFDVHLVALDLRDEAVAAQAEALYERLEAGGLRMLYDDRDASAGVKFNDADLIGIPFRLTVSKRSPAEGRIEAKWRTSADRLRLDEAELDEALARLRGGR